MTAGARPARAEARILEATVEELAANGFAGLTVEKIAAAAGVGRATIYRHWETRADLVMAAVRSVAEAPPIPDTGSLRGDLLELATRLADSLSGSATGMVLPVLVEAAQRDPVLAQLHDQLVTERRARAMPIVDRAVERGELPADADREMVLDLIVAPLFYRHLLLRRSTTPELVAAIVDCVLAGLRGSAGA